MRAFVHPRPEEMRLETLLYALGDPIRLAIVKRLRGNDGTACGECSPCPDLPKSTLSHHFRILREAGLVRTEKKATAHCNVLRYDEVEERFPGLLAAILGCAQRS